MVAKLGQGATYISGANADAMLPSSFLHAVAGSLAPRPVAFFKMPPRERRRVALSMYRLLQVAAV